MRIRAITFLGMLAAMVFLMCSLAGADDGEAVAKAASGKGPVAAVRALGDDGQLRMSDGDRCPMCGMFPAKRPKSAAGMMLVDGRTFYFCGNGCLLRSWHNAPTYLGVARESIQRMVVRDYFSGAPLDARGAWWVAGSDVIGPMGPALVTLKDSAQVEQFKRRHGARTIFQMDQMDAALWDTLFPPK